MDGTLVDSTGIWKQIDKDFFARRGINEVPPEYSDEIVHLGLEAGAKMTIEKYGFKNDTVEGLIKEWRDASFEQYEKYIPLKTGAIEILEFLKNNDVKIALATANEESLYMPCLKRLDILKYFDVIMDVNKVKEGKSSAKLYNTVAKKLNSKPENILVFEDVVTGLKTAYENGYISVGVFDEGSIASEELKKKYSYIYIKSFENLFDWF